MGSQPNTNIKFDGSATGGDSTANAGGLHYHTVKAAAGHGTAGDARIGAHRQFASTDIKLTGQGGNASSNRGGEVLGGNGKGGSLTLD